MDFRNLQSTSSDVEINQLMASNKSMRPSKEVEIFSALVNGKDTSKYGKDVDTTIEMIQKKGEMALNGNYLQQIQAKAELNSIREMSINTPLQKRLELGSAFGNLTTVGLQEKLEVIVTELQGDKSRTQASSGSFVFPTAIKKTYSCDTQTATGGVAIDYREYASGSIDALGYANEQVLTDIQNQFVYAQIAKLKEIATATTMKNYAQGVTEANVKAVRDKARRFGNVVISGDYEMISKLNGLQTFPVNAGGTEWRLPQSVMEEIVKTGLIKIYNGTPVVEIPNTYDMTQVVDGFYKPYLPTDSLFFTVQGEQSPLQIVKRGGLTSMTQTDINTRQQIMRYDLEYGNLLIPERIPMIGLITL